MTETTILQLLHGMSVGGAEVLAARLARGLRDRYRFVFGCLDHVGELGEELKDDGFPVFMLNRRAGLDWGCTRRLRKLVRREHVDLIHAHQYTPFSYALMSRFPGLRRPVLFTEHGRFHPDFPRRKRMLFNRTFLRRGDRVVAVGAAVRQALIDNEGIPGPRIEVVYNGIDLTQFDDLTFAERRATRRELGIGDEEFVAILVGRLDYLKDHLTAVRAAERLAVSVEGFRLLLVGDGSERAKIERAVAQRGLQNSVTLLGTRRDVSRLFNAADLCLLSSISEGIPLTLIEGMAAGLPVVSTDVGGVAEVVRDGITGLLVPAEDDTALAERVRQLAEKPDRRASFGAAGRARAQDVFAEPTMHEAYCRHFDQMTPHQPAQRNRDAVAVEA